MIETCATTALHTEIVVVEDNNEDRETIVSGFHPYVMPSHIVDFSREEEARLFVAQLNATDQPRLPESLRLFILDFHLDKDTVLPLLKLLRSGPITRCVPAVIFSDSNEPDNIRQCYDAGANAFVVKPVDFQSFSEAVQHIAGFWLETNWV